MGWSILFIVAIMTAMYVVGEQLYERHKWPHKYTCPYCKAVGTKFTFKSNEFSLTRQVQLDHLDQFHSSE